MTELASPTAQGAFRAVLAVLEGVSPNDARDALVNAMARVLVVEAELMPAMPTLDAMGEAADAMALDVRESLALNWPGAK